MQAAEIDWAEWRSLARSCHNYNFQQWPDYARQLRVRGVRPRLRYLAVQEDDKNVVAAALLRVYGIPGIAGVAHLAGGPLVLEHLSTDRFQNVLTSISAWCAERVLLLVIRPQASDQANWRSISSTDFDESEASVGTALINLRRPLDEIRADLHSKWRYSLRKAESFDLVVQEGGLDLFPQFLSLYDEMLKRKGYRETFSPRICEPMLSGSESANIRVVLATSNEEPLSGGVFSFGQQCATYLFGASNPRAHQLHAAYLVQWRAISLSVSRGLSSYDVGGIDSTSNPGVARFKERMNGEAVVLPKALVARTPGLRLAIVRKFLGPRLAS